MPASIEILWHNGHRTTGSTWREVEAAIRSAQWQPYSTRREFREDMRRRAQVWSGRCPRNARGSSKRFLTALADSGMFMLHTNEKENVG
jgi:hypothetical protein